MTMRNRYRTANYDPHWVTLKYRGLCSRCKSEIKPGENAFFYPSAIADIQGGAAYYCDMPDCGKLESDRFDASADGRSRYTWRILT